MKSNFQEELIRQIVLRTKKITYRGVDISAPYQVSLYWKLAGNPELYNKYSSNKNDFEQNELLFSDSISRLNALQKSWTKSKKTTYIDNLKLKIRKIIFGKPPVQDYDFLFFIGNKKHYEYLSEVRKELIKRGYKIALLALCKDIISNTAEPIIYPITSPIDVESTGFKKVGHFCVNKINPLLSFFEVTNCRKVIIVEGDTTEHIILGTYRKKLGIDIYCIQWGYIGTPVAKLGWQKMNYTKFLGWGEFFNSNFKKLNPAQYFATTGYPKLLLSANTKKQNIILFAIQKPMPPYIETGDIKNFITIAKNIAAAFPQYIIRLRSHPDYSLSDKEIQSICSLKNIEWHSYRDYSLSESLGDVKYCVSYTSTTNLEAVNLGVIPVYLRLSHHLFLIHQQLEEENIGTVAASEGELKAFIISTQKDPVYNKRVLVFSKKLFYSSGYDAVTNIVREITTGKPRVSNT